MASPVVAAIGAYNSGGGTVTLAAPAGISDGDLLLAIVVQQDALSTSPTLSGWTLRATYADTANGDCVLNVLTKTAASESGSYAFVSVDASYQTGVVMRITGADTSSPTDVVGTGQRGSSSTATALSVTTTVAETRLIWIAGFFLGATEATAAPSGMTLGVGEAFSWAHKEQTTAAATGDQAGTLSGSDSWSAIMLAIKGAGGGGSSVPVIQHHYQKLKN